MTAQDAPLNAPNGVHDTPQPGRTVLDSINNDNGTLSSAADSPLGNSPVTPPSAFLPAVNIKLSAEFPESVSDARDEPPIPVDIDKLDASSTRAQLSTPITPAIPTSPPIRTPPRAGQLPEDIEMSEPPKFNDAPSSFTKSSERTPTINGKINGHTPAHGNGANGVSPTHSPSPQSSTPIPADQVQASQRRVEVEGISGVDVEEERPAKRARKSSDADQTIVDNFATPPPPSGASGLSTSPVNGRSPTPTMGLAADNRLANFSLAQFRFCTSTIRTLKKQKDAAPFLHPVDPVALNIPHYPSIIKHPMDFSTIERKLQSSNPSKPDPNPNNPRYLNADEFAADVRLIFNNSLTFNGPDHIVTQMGKRVEAIFDKQVKQMPAPEEPKPPVVKKLATPPPPPPPPQPVVPKKVPARRPSTSVPTIRRSETETARPKREIHPPPPKDLPYADAPKKARRGSKAKRDDGTSDQLKYCAKILADLHKKQYWEIANPFYEPVDWVKLDIPSYPKIIKKPMDLATMKKKLDEKEYPSAAKFHDDFKLLIRNCFTFNPSSSPVYQAATKLQHVFEEKWGNLPPLHQLSDDEEEEEEESDDEHDRAIAMMESQIEAMKSSVAAMKQKKIKEEKKKKKKREKFVPEVKASSSKVKEPKPAKVSTKKKSKKMADDDVLSFDQKKDLSETIATLEGEKLEKVITIIHEGVPEIRNSNEEIELDIDSLPASVLMKLYNFVLRPLRPGAPKRNRTGTGTGGLKRKSMDEDVEAEKIRQLEERMRLFDGNAAASTGRQIDSVHSSDDSSSDSSGSESE